LFVRSSASFFLTFVFATRITASGWIGLSDPHILDGRVKPMKTHLSIERVGGVLRGLRLSGSEGMSKLFRYEIDVVRDFPIDGIAGALGGKLG
jgi:hypothetical protein